MCPRRVIGISCAEAKDTSSVGKQDEELRDLVYELGFINRFQVSNGPEILFSLSVSLFRVSVALPGPTDVKDLKS